MYRLLKETIAWILIAGLTLSGCAGMQTGSGGTSQQSPAACMAMYTVGGAAAGAAIGALIGAVAGGGKGAGKGAAGGAIGGAALGFAYAWGKCFVHYSELKSEPVKDYKETAKAVNYTPTKGNDLKINNYAAQPSAVAPGGTVTFKGDYYVMTPTEKDVVVTETRVLKVFDPGKKQFVELGKVPEQITVAPGLRRADGSFTIPSEVEEGEYMIEFLVTAEGKSDKASIPLTITNDKTLLASAKTVSGGKAIGGGSIVTVTAASTPLRKGPDSKSSVVVTARKGDRFPLVKQDTISGKNWFEVRLDNGDTAWIIGSTAKLTEE